MDQENSVVPVLSVKEWFITFIITAIPIVNLVMLFVWGFGDEANPNKANWAKASLLMMVAMVGLYIIVALVFFGVMFSGMDANTL
ncbi:MAG: hypothetical protein ACQETE_06620 [Bacteroidota bacterium]